MLFCYIKVNISSYKKLTIKKSKNLTWTDSEKGHKLWLQRIHKNKNTSGTDQPSYLHCMGDGKYWSKWWSGTVQTFIHAQKSFCITF